MSSGLDQRTGTAERRTISVVGALILITLLSLAAATPRLRQARATLEQERALDIAAENRTYCERWGMRQRTRAHSECSMDLDALRDRHERRILADMQGLI
jgi:hypothetical protein